MESRNLLGPTAGYAYVLGGHGTFTLVGAHSRYTYKLGMSEDQRSPIFVKVLAGSDNENDYQYIGYIPNPGGTTNVRPMALQGGKKGNPEHPAFKALAWWLEAYRRDSPGLEQAEFWHEGRCCKCGRKLTTPESIAAGIGPVCAGEA